MPDRSVECSGAGLNAASCVLIGSAGFPAFPIEGSTAAGHSVAQSCEQVGLQQPISSWLMPDDDEAAIGQFAAGTANAGPEASVRDKASTMRAIRRRIALQLS